MIHTGDCLELFDRLPDESVDLIFADPPFNVGYEYDTYDDRRSDDDYLRWCEAWLSQCWLKLRPSGSFWLAMGDEYVSDLDVLCSRWIRFIRRSWVVWYYTFGVNCKYGFSRSHTHLLYFVKDPKQFVFNLDDPDLRVPSARQLVYKDKRACGNGRLPDNTWILRPHDFQSDRYGFDPTHDTWYVPRVCGTHKERRGFHGCQMPEQVLGRIIRACSNPGDVVLDPFAGSGTTCAAAKKLGRQPIGFELSPFYASQAQERVDACQAGDPLEGLSDPIGDAA